MSEIRSNYEYQALKEKAIAFWCSLYSRGFLSEQAKILVNRCITLSSSAAAMLFFGSLVISTSGLIIFSDLAVNAFFVTTLILLMPLLLSITLELSLLAVAVIIGPVFVIETLLLKIGISIHWARLFAVLSGVAIVYNSPLLLSFLVEIIFLLGHAIFTVIDTIFGDLMRPMIHF